MTTPTGPIQVEITTGEPGVVEITKTPAPGVSVTTAGPQGIRGEKGDKGDAGAGIPVGGSVGQVLVQDATGEVVWDDPVTGIPPGGDTGQVLQKNSAADSDIGWIPLFPTGAPGEVLKLNNSGDVEWGAGVPAGGTTNQVLKKTSDADFDATWAAAPTPVPVGGTSGQVLKKNSATDYDMAWAADNGLIDSSTTKGDLIARTTTAMSRLAIGQDGAILTADSAQATGMRWATPTGWFRGEWVADTIAYDQGFGSGSIPAPFTGSHVGSASDPYLVSTGAVGGSASPYISAVKMQVGNINNGHSSTLTLPLASLGIAGITRIKVWTGKTDSNLDSSIAKNGANVFAQHQTTYGWTEREFTASSTDTFTFNCYGAYGVNSGSSGGLFITGVRVYATASPYMTGQFVTYNGKLWKSTSDSNGTTPGASGALWAEIPLNQMTSAVNAQVGTTYTPVLLDAEKLLTLTNAAAVTVTVPPNSSVAYPTTTKIHLLNMGAGRVTVAPGAGVTINKASGTLSLGQYQSGTLTKTATDTWVFTGVGSAVDVTTTKGDLLVRDANTLVRQAVGTDGQVLSADSTQASGTKWTTLPGARPTATGFLATTPFYIAHRGSGDVYPEHTMESYSSSVASGAKAIEVSVSRTADGVLVCHHDLNTLRMTGIDAAISDKYYSSLKRNYPVLAETFLGPAWAPANGKVNIPTLREVFERFGGKVVLFVEPKDPSAACVDETIAMINEFGINESVVWKEYNALNYVKARTANLKVWGYLADAADTTTIDTVVSRSDYMGVSVTNTDAFFTTVIGKGKPVIAWPLSRRSEVTRVRALGVVGLMSAGWKYLTATAPLSTKADGFKEGTRMPGEIPLDNSTAAQQPGWDVANQARTFPGNAGQSLVLGSLCPIAATTYSITFDMVYDTLPSDLNLHAGIAFGKASDDKYQFSTANATGGYHVLLRGNGDLQLYTHAAATTTGTQLATTSTTAPVAGQWMTVKVDVTPTQVTVTRTDADAGVTNTITVTNNAFRGGYVHLSKHSVTSANTVKFRNVVIS